MNKSEWSQVWQEYHEQGLASLIESGRVLPTLFVEPGHDGARILAAIAPRGNSTWRHWQNGRLMAGVGSELLLRGLYLKRRFSMRVPRKKSHPLAALGSPEDQLLKADRHVSFDWMLQDHNLVLLEGNPGRFVALKVGREWRDPPAHIIPRTAVETGFDRLGFGMALRSLHSELLDGAGPEYVAKISTLLETTRSLFP